MMKRIEYMEELAKAYREGRISEDAYDAALMNIDAFCDDDEED